MPVKYTLFREGFWLEWSPIMSQQIIKGFIKIG